MTTEVTGKIYERWLHVERPMVSLLIRNGILKSGLPVTRITRSDAGPESEDVIIIAGYPASVEVQLYQGKALVTIHRLRDG